MKKPVQVSQPIKLSFPSQTKHIDLKMIPCTEETFFKPTIDETPIHEDKIFMQEFEVCQPIIDTDLLQKRKVKTVTKRKTRTIEHDYDSNFMDNISYQID